MHRRRRMGSFYFDQACCGLYVLIMSVVNVTTLVSHLPVTQLPGVLPRRPHSFLLALPQGSGVICERCARVQGGGGVFLSTHFPTATMPIRPSRRPLRRAMVFERRGLPPKHVRGALSAATLGGHPKKKYATITEAMDDMFKPILRCLSEALEKNGASELIPKLTNYILFRVMLWMWRPRRVDDVWHPTALCAHKGLASLLTREEYYKIHRLSNCGTAELLEAINAHWSSLWVWGWAAAGDESIVPHKGKRAGPMRQFIPRKPHSTGIKLYVLGDSVHPFITDIFLYAGKRVRVFRDYPQVAGPRTAREMVHRWADLLPTRTAIVCDSYFGSHLVANQMAQRQQPFLFLCKRDQEGVSLAGDSMRPSIAAETYVKGGKYSLHVYKNPKVGSKPPRVVPFLSNCVFDNEWVRHRGGYEAVGRGRRGCRTLRYGRSTEEPSAPQGAQGLFDSRGLP